MTTIPPTNGTSGGAQTSTTKTDAENASLNYDDFLNLMVAQLRNQDPLNPTDSTQYMSQIAQFSTVEQGIKTNSKLDQLLTNSNISQASTMIGLTMTSADGATAGVVVSVRIDSSGSTAILDNGKEIPIAPGVTLGF
jgi:flagellar basal-body rod modification protein FlgD